MYYLRTRPAVDPIKFTVDKSRLYAKTTNGAVNQDSINSKITVKNGSTTIGSEDERLSAGLAMACSLKDDNGGCMMCSS